MVVNQNKIEKNETKNKTSLKTFLGGFSEVEREFFDERAAIMEFDGGMCRKNAETEEAKLTLIFFGKTKLFREGIYDRIENC